MIEHPAEGHIGRLDLLVTQLQPLVVGIEAEPQLVGPDLGLPGDVSVIEVLLLPGERIVVEVLLPPREESVVEVLLPPIDVNAVVVLITTDVNVVEVLLYPVDVRDVVALLLRDLLNVDGTGLQVVKTVVRRPLSG